MERATSLLAGGLLLAAWLLGRSAAALELEDCRVRDANGVRSVAARCGWLSVPQDYDDPDGHKIELFVALVPALSQTPAETPLTPIAGGPGGASTEFYAAYAGAFSRVQRNHDILLVDQRGTGRSNPLDCPVPEELEAAQWSLELVRESAEKCLKELAGDPRFYTTSVAVRDLDRVREALGYEQLNLYGSSYGTRVAQHYLRRYPEHTRSVILDGVIAAEEPVGPAIALDAQSALDMAVTRCSADAQCAERFSDLRATIAELFARLEEAPVTLTMPDPVDGATAEVTFSAMELAVTLRLLSYATDTVALLPLLLDTAGHGDFRPLAAQGRMVLGQLSESLSYGMHNAVVCTEDAPFYAALDIDRQRLEATYLGTSQLDTLEEICGIWPRGVLDADLRDPVISATPVLLLSGEADPVTPPANADRVAAHLGNALHIVARGQGHGVAHVGCMPRVMAAFVEQASLSDLDADCIDAQGPAPFFLGFTGPDP